MLTYSAYEMKPHPLWVREGLPVVIELITNDDEMGYLIGLLGAGLQFATNM